MKKQTSDFNGKKVYLLGVDKEGDQHYLVEASWDCGWYQGFGYVETFTNNKHPYLSADVKSHSHFDYLFFNKGCCAHDAFKKYFKDTPLSDKEIWKLTDLMISFYRFKEAAETLRHGYSNQTESAKLPEVQNTKMEKEINEKILPAIFKEIYKILDGGDAE